MSHSVDYLKSLKGKTVGIRFTDGCFLEVRIVSTDHLEERDDMVGEVRSSFDNQKDQPGQGCFISFKGSAISEIEILKE